MAENCITDRPRQNNANLFQYHQSTRRTWSSTWVHDQAYIYNYTSGTPMPIATYILKSIYTIMINNYTLIGPSSMTELRGVYPPPPPSLIELNIRPQATYTTSIVFLQQTLLFLLILYNVCNFDFFR